MQFHIFSLLLATAIVSPAIPDFETFGPTIKEVVENAVENAVEKAMASRQEKSLAHQILAFNPVFSDKFGIRPDMSAEEVAKQLDRAVLRTRIGNGIVGGLVGAGAGAGYVKFNDWRNNYKKMQEIPNGSTSSPPTDATAIPPPNPNPSANSTA